MRFAAALRKTTGTPRRSTALAVGLGLAALSACSGSSSGEFSGDLFVRSCSLACADGSGGNVVTCQVVNVTENQEISILFSEPIDATSVTPSSLQVTNTANGTAPEGLRFVDPLDSRRVIFRPSIAFEGGGIAFSFETNQTYEILIPGQVQGDAGPFIRSIAGNPNQSRLSCSVETTEGIADIVPGNPFVTVEVDVVTAYLPDGEPDTTSLERVTIEDLAGNPSQDIYRGSNVYFSFNELMFLPTVADNASGLAPFIRVQFDGDGSLATAGSERLDLEGSYEVTVDDMSLRTELVFDPLGTIPSAGDGPVPNLLVVQIPTEVTDAAGNPVTSATGGGVLAGIPEVILFDEVVIPEGGETFDGVTLEDSNATGAVWANGRLSPGISGGSGRLGELRIASGETVTLNTDSTTFPLIANVSEIDVIGNGSGATYPTSITVTDGVFEFSKLIVEPLGRLVFEGSNPARLVVRGSCVIAANGLVDVTGTSPAQHDSQIQGPQVLGQVTPAAGGPSAGAGGLGGDRVDLLADLTNFGFVGIGGIANPGAIRAGQAGEGVGGAVLGGGGGGPEYPAGIPIGIQPQVDGSNMGGMGLNVIDDPLGLTVECVCQQMASPGGGGAYALDGGEGLALPVGLPVTEAPALVALVPPAAPGGSSAGLGLAVPNANNTGYVRRLLRWQDGNLVGGSGGGGGGNHYYGTSTDGAFVDPPTAVNCLTDFAGGIFASFNRWRDHSGAQGGGGGGAIEFTMGRTFELDGIIDASGGAGASALSGATADNSFAIPGGGGSGGAIRIRAGNLDIGGGAQINIDGGLGGAAPWSLNQAGTLTRGGDGSPGLLRIEDNVSGTTFDDIAARVIPGDSMNPMASLDFLSYAPTFFDPTTAGLQRPDSISGATSCWIRPEGAFLRLIFPEDEAPSMANPNPGPEDMGWTMDVVLDDGMGGEILRPYRGFTGTFGDGWETQFGNLLGYDLMVGESAAPIVVRFQGALTGLPDLNEPGQTVIDPCDLDITDPQAGGRVLQSVTPWVSHPADLNQVLTADAVPYTINMIRYCVIFDATNDGADQPGLILQNQQVLGVDNIRVRAQPE